MGARGAEIYHHFSKNCQTCSCGEAGERRGDCFTDDARPHRLAGTFSPGGEGYECNQIHGSGRGDGEETTDREGTTGTKGATGAKVKECGDGGSIAEYG